MTEVQNKGDNKYLSSLRVHLVMEALVKVFGPEQWAERKFGLLEDSRAILQHLRDDSQYALVDIWDEENRAREEVRQANLERQAKHRKLIGSIDRLLAIHSRSPQPRTTEHQGYGVEVGEHYCLGCTISLDRATLYVPHPCYIARILTEALDG